MDKRSAVQHKEHEPQSEKGRTVQLGLEELLTIFDGFQDKNRRTMSKVLKERYVVLKLDLVSRVVDWEGQTNIHQASWIPETRKLLRRANLAEDVLDSRINDLIIQYETPSSSRRIQRMSKEKLEPGKRKASASPPPNSDGNRSESTPDRQPLSNPKKPRKRVRKTQAQKEIVKPHDLETWFQKISGRLMISSRKSPWSLFHILVIGSAICIQLSLSFVQRV